MRARICRKSVGVKWLSPNCREHMICPLPRANDLTAPNEQLGCHGHPGGGDDLYPGCSGAGHEGCRGSAASLGAPRRRLPRRAAHDRVRDANREDSSRATPGHRQHKSLDSPRPGPRRGTVVLADAVLTPTLEPSLLSSQVQQRPGHPPAQQRAYVAGVVVMIDGRRIALREPSASSSGALSATSTAASATRRRRPRASSSSGCVTL
jgi:hypothetical protein